MMNLDMENAAIELDRWLRFASCSHLGYIGVAVTNDELLVYWDKSRMTPGGMPDSFAGFPVKIKQMARPIPAAS
jgi:hypothetical protein